MHCEPVRSTYIATGVPCFIRNGNTLPEGKKLDDGFVFWIYGFTDLDYLFIFIFLLSFAETCAERVSAHRIAPVHEKGGMCLDGGTVRGICGLAQEAVVSGRCANARAKYPRKKQLKTKRQTSARDMRRPTQMGVINNRV